MFGMFALLRIQLRTFDFGENIFRPLPKLARTIWHFRRLSLGGKFQSVFRIFNCVILLRMCGLVAKTNFKSVEFQTLHSVMTLSFFKPKM